jgi:hypothetical protein
LLVVVSSAGAAEKVRLCIKQAAKPCVKLSRAREPREYPERFAASDRRENSMPFLHHSRHKKSDPKIAFLLCQTVPGQLISA